MSTGREEPGDSTSIPGLGKRQKPVTIGSIFIGNCPLCGEALDSAVYDTKADKSDPYWGEPGKRFLICRDGAHTHIEVHTPEGVAQRYAFVIPYSLPKPKRVKL